MAVFGIDGLPRPPRRTETAVRPQIASRTRETRSTRATPRRRQPSRAPTWRFHSRRQIRNSVKTASPSRTRVLECLHPPQETDGRPQSRTRSTFVQTCNSGPGSCSWPADWAVFEIGVLLTPSFRTMTPRQPKFAVLTRLSSSDRANKAAGQPSRASATSSRRRRHQRTVWGGVGGRVAVRAGRDVDAEGACLRGHGGHLRSAQH